MATVKQIRALCRRRSSALPWEEVKVTAREFKAEDWCEWMEEMRMEISPCGHGWGHRVCQPSGGWPANFQRERLPLMACINGHDERDEKWRKVYRFLQNLIPEFFRGVDKDLEARRLIAAHAEYLPLVRVGRFIDSGEAFDDKTKGIPLYALTDDDVNDGSRNADWKAAKLAELAERRAWYNAALENTADAELQRKLQDALSAWQRAGNLFRDARLSEQAGLLKLKAWRKGILKRLAARTKPAKARSRPKTAARKRQLRKAA